MANTMCLTFLPPAFLIASQCNKIANTDVTDRKNADEDKSERCP